jgi:DNA-directed RNA polymerase subunit K/omega
MSREPSSPSAQDIVTATIAVTTPATASSSFDERWEAWQAKGAAHERAFRRKLALVAPVVVIVAAAVFYALVIRWLRIVSRIRKGWSPVVQRPTEVAAFEFAVLAGLRAGQLARGCSPRVTCSHKITVIAQLEVAARKVVRQVKAEPGDIRFARWHRNAAGLERSSEHSLEVSGLPVVGDYNDGEEPWRQYLLALPEVRRGVECLTPPAPTFRRKAVAVTPNDLARQLHELIAALDQRAPRVEQAGEDAVARDVQWPGRRSQRASTNYGEQARLK